MERPTVIMKLGNQVAILATFKDRDFLDLFKEEMEKDQTETPVEFEVKNLTLFLGNAVIKPKG